MHYSTCYSLHPLNSVCSDGCVLCTWMPFSNFFLVNDTLILSICHRRMTRILPRGEMVCRQKRIWPSAPWIRLFVPSVEENGTSLLKRSRRLPSVLYLLLHSHTRVVHYMRSLSQLTRPVLSHSKRDQVPMFQIHGPLRLPLLPTVSQIDL